MRHGLSFLAGILLTLLASKVWYYTQQDSRIYRARADLRVLEIRLSQLKDTCGKYPSQNIGLNALFKPGLINCNAAAFIEGEKILKDPFEKEYVYLENDKSIYLLSSIKEIGFIEIPKY